MTRRKKWLTPLEQVDHLKSKGVKFELISEVDAISYLEKNSNYFRLRAYRTGFPRVNEGKRAGEYANLDFMMLVDLSIIDMRLRYELLPITLDIEHFAKVRLLKKLEEHREDGYQVVQDFLSTYDKVKPDGTISNRVKSDIEQGMSSPYVRDLIEKYADYDYPVWAFIEVISFGTFNYFYRFCGNRFGDKDMIDQFYLLQSVKSLRNACAHNNCIINDLKAGEPQYPPRNSVSEAVAGIPHIGSGQRKAKLSNDRIQQIVTALYVHTLLASPGVIKHRAETLASFVDRMNRNINYYAGNLQIKTTFEFLGKVIKAWFPLESCVETPKSNVDG